MAGCSGDCRFLEFEKIFSRNLMHLIPLMLLILTRFDDLRCAQDDIINKMLKNLL